MRGAALRVEDDDGRAPRAASAPVPFGASERGARGVEGRERERERPRSSSRAVRERVGGGGASGVAAPPPTTPRGEELDGRSLISRATMPCTARGAVGRARARVRAARAKHSAVHRHRGRGPPPSYDGRCAVCVRCVSTPRDVRELPPLGWLVGWLVFIGLYGTKHAAHGVVSLRHERAAH